MRMAPAMDAVGVVGLGMVGGTVARAFSDAGVTVHGYDRYLDIGSAEALGPCRVVFLCVPTPSLPDRGYDLGEVWSAAHEIESYLQTGTIVVVKSTVSPGTNDRLAAAFPRLEFASLPEFLVEARPLETFTHPDRLIIGARSSEAGTILRELLATVAPEAPAVFVQPIEAELTKLCSNVLLAAKVAMANQLSDICEHYEVSWPRIKSVVGLDRRIGPDHLSVTEERGFGGSCLPKDLDGLIAAAETVGCGPQLLEAIAEFNRRCRARTQIERSNGKGSTSGSRAGNGASSGPLELALVDESVGLIAEDTGNGNTRKRRP
jgi:UDPglucose 6-dehydrogenase